MYAAKLMRRLHRAQRMWPGRMERKKASRARSVGSVVPVRIMRKPFSRRDSIMDTSEKNLEDLIEQALLSPRVQTRAHTGKDRQVKEHGTTSYQLHRAISGWEGVTA